MKEPVDQTPEIEQPILQEVKKDDKTEITKKEDGIKKFGSYIPQFAVLIIVLGIVKEILYYWNFNLPIKYFLGLSELGLIISDNLMFLIPYTFICIGLLFLARNFIFLLLLFAAKKGLKHDENKFGTRDIIIFTVFVLVYSVYKISKIYNIPTYHDKLFESLKLAYWIVSCMIASFLFYVTRYHYKNTSLTTNYFISCYLGLMVTFIMVMALGEIHDVEKGKYTGTIITTKDDKSDTSNDTHYFIGKTEKYVFFFNKKDTTTTILPMDEIKKIVLKEK